MRNFVADRMRNFASVDSGMRCIVLLVVVVVVAAA